MTNLERLAEAKRRGSNVIHPVPGSTTYESDDGSDRAIKAYFDEAERLGLWVMYDLRHCASRLVMMM